MLRPRNEVRRLKVPPRKAKPFAEIYSGEKRKKASALTSLAMCRSFDRPLPLPSLSKYPLS
ncbi:hypothetical protein FZC76_07730 [Sutcliffiella horikoshii]|uniref:Uncharacterized protein n=1 Tax=Sutcliffiella horikoshii TaxID=79883 RepID=A0A5D4T1I5_9BACI|nr:hypothetical protein FZC76_07730 [Sutcliffiella horikoshii]